MAKISIIIPMYNAERTIQFSLGSILNQDYQDYEVLVVDDGSTDGSRTIVEKMSDKFSGKISYYYQDNSGQSSARNLGLKLAQGQYICFLDSDDWFDKNYLKYLIEFIELNHLDVVECDFQVTQKMEYTSNVIKTDSYILSGINILENYLYKGIKIPNSSYSVCNKMFRKESIEDVFFSLEPFCEDYLFNFIILKNINLYGKLDYIGYNYYRNNKSSTQSPLKIQDKGMINNCRTVYNLALDTGNKTYISYARTRYYHSFFSLKALRYGYKEDAGDFLKELKKGMRSGLRFIINSKIPKKRIVILLFVFLSSNFIKLKKVGE